MNWEAPPENEPMKKPECSLEQDGVYVGILLQVLKIADDHRHIVRRNTH